jgi:hypothetical protein
MCTLALMNACTIRAIGEDGRVHLWLPNYVVDDPLHATHGEGETTRLAGRAA